MPADAATSLPMAPADTVPASKHVPYIDGLRAIAVLAVIAYHLEESWLPGGFAGVDVFFAISGFVVAASVHAWNRGGVAAFLGYFYARRVQRIVPALVACLLLTSFLSMLFIPAAWLSRANEQTGLHAFFGLSNWFLANHRENYFSPTTEFNPYTHTWSLGVEEQFYLLFPLMFFAWTRGGRWRGVSLALFALALAGSLAWAFRLARVDPTAGFYLIQSRLWELASGVLLFQLLTRFARTDTAPRRGGGLFAAAGAWTALGLLATGLVLSTPRSFPLPGALLPVLGTLGLIGFLHARPPSLLATALGSRPMTAIGRMSYSLYLWHWPVFVLLRWTSGLDDATTRLAGVVATFAFAAASYRWVERPLRYSPLLRRWPRTAVVAAGVLLILSGWLLATGFIVSRPALALTTVSRNGGDWHASLVHSLADVAGCRLLTRPAMAGGGSLLVMQRTACATPEQRPPTIFALGDSHATGYMTLLSEHVLRSGATVVLYYNPGCTFASLQPQREGGRCGAQGKAAIDDILSRADTGDIVLLAALRLSRLSNQFARTNEAAAWESMTASVSLAGRRKAEGDALVQLQPLAARGLHIVLEAPKPLLRSPPFRCADWFNASNPICEPGLAIAREEVERYRKPVLDSFARMAAQVSAISIWDPLPILCPGRECLSSMDGRPLYFDGDHLSGYGNRMLLPSFERHLAAVIQTTR